MLGDIVVRRAGPTDAAAIAELHLASHRVAYLGLLPNDTIEQGGLAARTVRWEAELRRGVTVFLSTHSLDIAQELEKIARQAPGHLLPGGWLLLEHGAETRGTNALLHALDRDHPAATRSDVEYLLKHANTVLREPLTGWSWLVERLPAVARLDDAVIAVGAAVALFAIPVDARRGVFALDWEVARKIPWGVLLLFGGGLSLANAVQATGVDSWIGDQTGRLEVLPTVALVAAVAAAVVMLTELTSNTATSATFLPILGGVAVGIGLEPLVLVIPVALSATFAFMLPVATPPNAIVFGSGHVTIGQMVRAGARLNALAVLLVTTTVLTLGRVVFGYAT